MENHYLINTAFDEDNRKKNFKDIKICPTLAYENEFIKRQKSIVKI